MSKNTAAPRAEPPRTRRPAASGKTSQGRKSRSIRPPTRSPAPSRPRRATPGENFAARQTAHQLSHRIRAGLVRGELRASADGPCTNRPTAPTQGHFRENSSGSSGQPARQLNPIAPAQSYFGENFTRTKATARQTAQQPAVPTVPAAFAQNYAGENFAARQTAPVPTDPIAPAQGHFRGNFTGMSDCPPVSPTQSHPHRGVPGKTSQGRKSRSVRQGNSPSVNRPHRTRAGPFQGKFHRHVRLLARQLSSTASAQGCSGKNFISPKTTAQQTAPRPHPIRRRNARRPVQPFWSNFAARWTAQRSFIRPSAPAKLLTHESARPTLARPNRNAPHAAPSDSATMSSA